MLKPSAQTHHVDGFMLAEFWDCLRLDPAPVFDLRTRYEDHLRQGGRPELIVNLAGVEFAGSAALGGFVSLHRVARQHGGGLIFHQVAPTVAEAFRISKLGALFAFAPDQDAALALARAEPQNRPRPTSSPSPSTGRGPLRRNRPTTDPE